MTSSLLERKFGFSNFSTKVVTILIALTFALILVASPITRASYTNLDPIPSAWGIYDNNPSSFTANVHLDATVQFNGLASIRIDNSPLGTNTARECDGQWTAIKPGDHIIFTCWIKTSISSLRDANPQSGARIGFDYYDNKGRITGIQYTGPYTTTYTDAQLAAEYVPWGTSTWVQRTIDTTVPALVYSDLDGSPHIPTAIIPTMQVWSITYGPDDAGQAWFANAIMNINSNNPATTSTIQGDFNNDGKVNFNDLVYFVQAFQQYNSKGFLDQACDLNHDGKIDFTDLTTFVNDYIVFNSF